MTLFRWFWCIVKSYHPVLVSFVPIIIDVSVTFNVGQTTLNGRCSSSIIQVWNNTHANQCQRLDRETPFSTHSCNHHNVHHKQFFYTPWEPFGLDSSTYKNAYLENPYILYVSNNNNNLLEEKKTVITTNK